INIAQKYLGVLVGHKFPAGITLRERLVADDTLEKEEKHEAYLQKQSFWRANERSSLNQLVGG
ncbi:hypothetical protein HZC08_02460, partial [Candidatus Micrarchaeota archaeon]|nr:hypothetical protein [Candidatus Micrarchaeota archaeon]